MVSQNLVDAIKNVVAARHVIRITPSKLSLDARGRFKALQLREKFYLTADGGRYELVQACYNRKAVVQNFGSQVVSYHEMGGTKVKLEVIVRRLPNISLGASGLERFLHPDSEFKTPIGAYKSLYQMSEDLIFGEALSLLFDERPEVAKAIDQHGGMAYLEDMHFEGDHESSFVVTLRKAYKRYCYLKSVSQYE